MSSWNLSKEQPTAGGNSLSTTRLPSPSSFLSIHHTTNTKRRRLIPSYPNVHTNYDEHPRDQRRMISENFQTLQEESQTLMEMLAISEANTQEYTQLLDASAQSAMRFTLHPQIQQFISPSERASLEKEGLYHFDVSRIQPRISLGRGDYIPIFHKSSSRIHPLQLSRTHCTIECFSNPRQQRTTVYLTDKSTNGVRVDGVLLGKGRKVKLRDGQTIALLSTPDGSILLGYSVEDPYLRQRLVLETSLLQSRCSSAASGRHSSQRDRIFQENTLGVLFSSPLVGKDVHGQYHPIMELDVKREYSNLQQSLKEAAQRVIRMPQNDDQSRSAFQIARQIHVIANFATTESFRVLVTMGCRALHFSGHGDDKQLYFEDGMGLVHPVPHSSLEELFSAGGKAPLRLVFVSACSSAPLAKAFVSCGIPHVIAVKTTEMIEDDAAIEFTRSFYLGLATGRSVQDSFAIAQQAISKSPNIRGAMQVADKFLLLPEASDHSEVIFPLQTLYTEDPATLAPLKLKPYPKLWFDDLPAICQGFCNRARDVYKICLALMITNVRITRLVTICGEQGIGKTAVAYSVAHYVGPRMTVKDRTKVLSVQRMYQDLEYDPHSAAKRANILVSLKESIRQHNRNQVSHMEKPALLVLDGCDCLLNTDVHRERFRSFISDLLTTNPMLKILITARSSLTSDGALTGVNERVFPLKRFDSLMSAKMLMAIVQRPIRADEIKRAQIESEDSIEKLASHPVLLATLGIPKRIADLAAKLNEQSMDDIESE